MVSQNIICKIITRGLVEIYHASKKLPTALKDLDNLIKHVHSKYQLDCMASAFVLN